MNAKSYECQEGYDMRFAGLLVMPAGFFLTLAALVLFPPAHAPARVAFVLCGLAVQACGLVVAIRGHLELQSGERS
jgi:hypothetical protein